MHLMVVRKSAVTIEPNVTYLLKPFFNQTQMTQIEVIDIDGNKRSAIISVIRVPF